MCTSEFCDPCEIFHCDFFKIHFYNPNSKIFVSTVDFSVKEFIIWNGKEILKAKVIQKIYYNDKVYFQFLVFSGNEILFTNSLEEFIIFLKQEDFLFIGCVQKHLLRKNLFTFLTLQEWYSEKTYDWKEICFSLE